MQPVPMTRCLAPPAAAALALLLTLAQALVCVPLARATPLYSAREGRACDNCHLTPNTWVNPRLVDRKCTLSCASCHVDPAGGGLRNASGRFFGRSTLPMIATSPRPTQDWDREVARFAYRRDRATTYRDSLPLGPDDFDAARAWAEPPRDGWGRGAPLASPSRYSLLQGRYGRLNADPLLRVGYDVRLAALLSQSVLVFPMQIDVGMSLHPIEHVSAVANVGARGRTRGPSRTLDDPRTPYLREGYLLLHEAPALAYAKAGRFVPAFGLRLDDHTAQQRRAFELDGALPETRATGVEVGANPNYPFVSVAWFRSAARDRAPAAFDPFDVDDGSGVAINAAYRELAWSLGASTLARRRPLDEGGDATSYAFFGVVNLWRWRRDLPLTYQAEFDFGRKDRASGLEAAQAAFYHELDWLAANGVNVLVAQDWVDPDLDVIDDDAYRVSAGVQVTPIPGVTVDTRFRVLVPAAGDAGADGFVQLHLWN